MQLLALPILDLGTVVMVVNIDNVVVGTDDNDDDDDNDNDDDGIETEERDKIYVDCLVVTLLASLRGPCTQVLVTST